ncbi:hypothetical protein EV1_026908 [Malus domestica]
MVVVDAEGMNGGDLGRGSGTRRRTAARVIARARPEARWISHLHLSTRLGTSCAGISPEQLVRRPRYLAGARHASVVLGGEYRGQAHAPTRRRQFDVGE